MMAKSWLLLMFTACTIWAAAPNEMITVTGVIELELGEDESTGILLITTSDEVFTIRNVGKGSELQNHVGEKVKITGEVFEDSDGNTLLSVADFEILEKDE